MPCHHPIPTAAPRGLIVQTQMADEIGPAVANRPVPHVTPKDDPVGTEAVSAVVPTVVIQVMIRMGAYVQLVPCIRHVHTIVVGPVGLEGVGKPNVPRGRIIRVEVMKQGIPTGVHERVEVVKAIVVRGVRRVIGRVVAGALTGLVGARRVIVVVEAAVAGMIVEGTPGMMSMVMEAGVVVGIIAAVVGLGMSTMIYPCLLQLHEKGGFHSGMGAYLRCFG